jgi:transcriptional regulator with XRE-family HTH domain
VKNSREWRLQLGWTLWELERASGVERTRLSHIENEHVVPKPAEQEAIRRALQEETARKNALLSAFAQDSVSA